MITSKATYADRHNFIEDSPEDSQAFEELAAAQNCKDSDASSSPATPAVYEVGPDGKPVNHAWNLRDTSLQHYEEDSRQKLLRDFGVQRVKTDQSGKSLAFLDHSDLRDQL